jgi:hypothetical protein
MDGQTGNINSLDTLFFANHLVKTHSMECETWGEQLWQENASSITSLQFLTLHLLIDPP